jgi:iron complex transport system ATP-binding protein
VTSLSEGERRRMWLARSLVSAPELLLADEPAAGLDIAGREHLVGVLERLAASGLSALVLVSHHLEEVPPGFTHALLLRDGTAVAARPIREILTDGPLSACYGMALRVTGADGRFWVRHVGRAGAPG